MHKKFKTRIAPLFTLANRPSMKPRVNQVLKCIHEKLEEKFVDNDYVLNLGDWLQFFVFDVIGTFTFSKPYAFLDTGKDFGGILASIVFFMRTSAPVWYAVPVLNAVERYQGLKPSLMILKFTQMPNSTGSSERTAWLTLYNEVSGA
jgi:hypothetical protein